MSSDIKTSRNENKTLESILPRRGKLLVAIKQLHLLQLKQPPPANFKVVVILSADGNTNVGVTDQPIQMTSINDVSKIGAAKALAHQLLGVSKKQEVETALARSVLKIVGPIDQTKLDPSPAAQQELRRVHMDIGRIEKNLEKLGRLPAPTLLEQKVRSYLTQMAVASVDALKKHVVLQLTMGSQPKELLSLAHGLMMAGVPKWVYAKLSQPKLVDNPNIRIDSILFGNKIGKGLKLSYEEMNSPVLRVTDLFEMLNIRNSVTIKAARNEKLAADMRAELDETEIRRLRKIQLHMVGPGNISGNWAAPQPLAPIPYRAIGGLLLEINRIEFNYHAGVLPLGMKPSEYWNKQVIADKDYPANQTTSNILAQVVEHGKLVQPNGVGYTIFPRDNPTGAQQGIVVRARLKDYIVEPEANPAPPKEQKVKEGEISFLPQLVKEALAAQGGEYKLPYPPNGTLKVKLSDYAPAAEIDNWLGSANGIAWKRDFVQKLFLTTSEDQVKKKRANASNPIPLSDEVVKGLKRLKLPQEVYSRATAFFMQFQSEAMALQAFKAFKAHIQLLEADGSYVAPDNAEQLGGDTSSEEDEDY